jgi:hypothetical protein
VFPVIHTAKFPGKVLDMDPCSSIDVGWIFIGEKSDLHKRNLFSLYSIPGTKIQSFSP